MIVPCSIFSISPLRSTTRHRKNYIGNFRVSPPTARKKPPRKQQHDFCFMIGQSLPAYVLIRSVIFFFQGIVLCSFLITFTSTFGRLYPSLVPRSLSWLINGSLIGYVVTIYATSEVYFYFWSKKRLERLQAPAKPPSTTVEERADTFMR